MEVPILFSVEDAACEGDDGVGEDNSAGMSIKCACNGLGGGDAVGVFVDFGEGLGAQVEGGIWVALDLEVDLVAFDQTAAVAGEDDRTIGVVGAGVGVELVDFVWISL